MGKVTGFLEFERSAPGYAPVRERVKHWQEFVLAPSEEDSKVQAARCMDCGIPYCHTGCPVNNQIPDWNDLVYHGDWKTGGRKPALDQQLPRGDGPRVPGAVRGRLHAQHRRRAGHHQGDRVRHRRPRVRGGLDRARSARAQKRQAHRRRRLGPAGLAAAQQLARAGHDVHVYEKNAKPGGLLRYGIPDFKMEKEIIERRVKQMEAEGVVFHCNSDVGKTVSAKELEETHDALLLAGGSEHPFDFFAKSPGRDLDGIHFAMDFLPQQNRRVSGEVPPAITDAENGAKEILAKDKHVIVIGGGDTGSDCIGTSFRQGAKSVTQLEIMPMPPEHENKAMTWPNWPLKLRVSTSQAEGANVEYSVSTTGFSGADGKIEKLHYVHVDNKLQPIPGSDAELPADLVLLAMGFSGPIEEGLVKELGLEVVARGRFKGLNADERDYKVPGQEKVFAAGDIRRGQSLVVWAIREGRQAAHAIDKFLMGKTTLPR